MSLHEELYKEAANALLEWQEGELKELMKENSWTTDEVRENLQVMCYVDTIDGNTTHHMDIFSRKTGKMLSNKAFQINFTGGMA